MQRLLLEDLIVRPSRPSYQMSVMLRALFECACVIFREKTVKCLLRRQRLRCGGLMTNCYSRCARETVLLQVLPILLRSVVIDTIVSRSRS